VRLSTATDARLSGNVIKPRYDRAKQALGMVHFGIGAFHRAHQAVYTDDAMNAGDHGWGIVGVSLRSKTVYSQMEPQNGLYTVRERQGSHSSLRLIGAVRGVLVASQSPAAVVSAIAAPDTRIITFTITEKGYHRGGDGRLDRASVELSSDLKADTPPRTIYGYLRSALSARRERGLPGVTLVCCDNLANNGAQLNALLEEFLNETDSNLLPWVQAHCRCPSSMVDRIVPATTAEDLEQTAIEIGLCDEATVNTEPFSQWVLEDDFAGPRPRWESGGAQFVQNVAPFETAKLRMLNGAHSALAYLGLARGYAFVHQAMADASLRTLVEQLMRREAAPTIQRTAGLDLNEYADALIARFTNAALKHRLAQIAMDGSQKIPQRWLETLEIQSSRSQDCPAIMEALAAWIAFLRTEAEKVGDPMAVMLAALWQRHGRSEIVDALFGPGGVFSRCWSASPEMRGRLSALVGGFTAD
jgi:fructuronate reductase